MTILGIDISHWSELATHPVNIVDQGYEFLIRKATQGSTYVDPTFTTNTDVYGNPLLAAFHYMDDSNPDFQFMNIHHNVPIYVPVIIDLEQGTLAIAQKLITHLREHGYTSPLFYLPEWKWVELGRPDISHMPPLWASVRVPGSGTGADLYRRVSANNWHPYGGNTPCLLQYTQRAHVAGIGSALDVSAFAGSRVQLDRLLHMTVPITPMPEPTYEYVVKPGDTLWEIAFKTLGDSAKWGLIAAANGITNPNRLLPGQRLTIPGWDGTYHEMTQAIKYTVKHGDTLTSIAAQFHVSVNALYAANRGTIGGDPNYILVGMVLSIPKVA